MSDIQIYSNEEIKIYFHEDSVDNRVSYPEVRYKGAHVKASSLFPLGKHRNNGSITLIGDEEKRQFEKDVTSLSSEFILEILQSKDDLDGEFD